MASTTGPDAETLSFQRIMSTILSTKSSGDFHDKWSSLAMALHTPSDRIKRIRDDLLVNKITLMDALHEIIEEWPARCGSAATIDKLIRAFEDLDLNSLGETLRLEFNLPCKDSENPSLSWDDIGSRFQQRVISSLETFYPSITFDHKLKSKLAGVVLVDLMTCKEPNPITNIIPQTLSYYVPRTLIPRDLLAKEFIRLSSDIFLFTGINISALSTVISSKSSYPRTDTTSSQINNRDPDVKYMILDRPNHFAKIKSLSVSTVHHVKFEEGQFYWVKSIGLLNNLRKCIDKHQNHLSEGEFLSKLCTATVTNRPVIISDSPGMGKSEVLKQVAGKITSMLPGRIVIFQEFPKFISFAVQLNKGTNERMVRIHSALQKLTCKGELERKILSSKLKSETVTIELLLDGYDELSESSVEDANDIIKEIYFSFKSIRLWITTRPHLLKNLEDMLTILGYTIQPFTPEDQINFLVSYWSREQDLPTDRLAQYATHCLEYLKSTLSTKDEDIAGIPLQCLMIGEVYEEEATDYSQSDAEFSGIKIWITSITDLYKLTIEKKMKKYQSTYGSHKLSQKEVISMHIQLSLKLIFPDYYNTVSSKFGRVEMKDVLNVGILESKEAEGNDSEPKFIHRTFAEYFVSLFVLNVLVDENWLCGDSDNGNLSELRLKEILQCKPTLKTEEFQYPVMCFFLNSLLSGKEVQVRFSHPFVQLFKSRLEIRKLAGACINSDFINIFNLFDIFKVFDKCGKQFFNGAFFLKAIQKSSADLIKKILQRFERFHELHIGFQRAAIRAAVARGEFTPVEFLLNERKFRKLLQGENYERMQILHCCVENSKDNSKEVIRQKVEVIQFLVKINSLILEETNAEGLTPLVCKNVHVRLLVKLIELDSNVFAKNDKNDTILHNTYFTPEEYHSVLTSIKWENTSNLRLVNVEGCNNDTPLLRLIKTVEPEEKTLDFFNDAGVDFSLRPLLPTATKKGRNATTLNKLIQCGSDVRWKGTNGSNILHLASEYCNLDAVSVIEKNNVDINALNNDFNTPLHIAARLKNYVDCLKMIKVLIECGGNAIVLNKGGTTFLHELLCSHRNIASPDFHDLIELLIQVKCANMVEVEDQFGDPFLIVALSKIEVEEKTLLLLRRDGVDLMKSTTGGVLVIGNATDIKDVVVISNADKNLLHAASQKGNYKVIPFLLQIGINVNGMDSSSMTPLHYACKTKTTSSPWENCFMTVKVLIENGANVYATADGATFLHILLEKCYFMSSKKFHDIAEFLVKNGHSKLFDIHGKNGVTPLQLGVALPLVKDETTSLLSTSGVKFDSVDDNGDCVLGYAIRGKKGRDCLKHLISCGGNVQQTNNRGQNLLHIAASSHNDDAIIFFLQLGIRVNEVDMDGNTPLHLHFESCLHSDKRSRLPATILLVGYGASVTRLNKKSMSPFSIARRRFADDYELMRLLLKWLAEEIGKLDEKGNSELHNAVFANNLPLVKKLVKTGVNVNVQNKKLETSLHIASSINEKNGALKIIRLLVDNNASPFINDQKNCTFLHILLATNTNLSPSLFHDLVDYLISKGHSKLLETAGWDNGTTPIHLALHNIDVEERTVTHMSTYVDWNLVDHQGRTPLHFITCNTGNSSLTSH